MIPSVVTIAGSDPTGGAGIQEDIKTFEALGVRGLSVVTALTAQNAGYVYAILPVPPEFIRSQFESLITDFQIMGIKIGMLYTSEVIHEVSSFIRNHHLTNVVVDPVLRASSGGLLLEEGGLEIIKKTIFPYASIVTPNIPEADALTGKEISDIEGMKEAAGSIYAMGPQNVLIKGGHLKGEIYDLFFDGKNYIIRSMVKSLYETRGTGCTLSAALAAGLARGLLISDAVSQAQDYTQKVIREAIPWGRGPRYPHHSFFHLEEHEEHEEIKSG